MLSLLSVCVCLPQLLTQLPDNPPTETTEHIRDGCLALINFSICCQQHENASLGMLDHMIKQNSRVKRKMAKCGILKETNDPDGFNPNGKYLKFIKNLIFPAAGSKTVGILNIY